MSPLQLFENGSNVFSTKFSTINNPNHFNARENVYNVLPLIWISREIRSSSDFGEIQIEVISLSNSNIQVVVPNFFTRLWSVPKAVISEIQASQLHMRKNKKPNGRQKRIKRKQRKMTFWMISHQPMYLKSIALAYRP